MSGSVPGGICLASVRGRSTGTPTVSSGAVTMKMISRTSITSTNGVTLISPAGSCGRDLRSPPAGFGDRHYMRSLRRRETRARLHRRSLPCGPRSDQIAGELVVENHRRNGRDKAERGGEQRFGDAGRHDGEIGLLLARDMVKAFMMPHTVPKRPMKAPRRRPRPARRSPCPRVRAHARFGPA